MKYCIKYLYALGIFGCFSVSLFAQGPPITSDKPIMLYSGGGSGGGVPVAHRSHPRGSTRSRGPTNDQNGEVTQSLVDEYLADRITVTEMCNRINVQLNLFPDDSHNVEQVTSLSPEIGHSRCYLFQ